MHKFDPPRKPRWFKVTFGGVFILALIVSLLLWGAIFYSAQHFIRKFW